MPGLVDRASVIAKAKVSKLLERAENPEETLDYSYEQQLVQLHNVKRGIADLATAKQRLQLQSASMQEQITKLDGQAREALQSRRADLAREALQRKATLQGQLDGELAAERAARRAGAEADRRREGVAGEGGGLPDMKRALVEGERTG